MTSSNNTNLLEFIQSENSSNQVVVWSKSYCPYCRQTKQLFESMGNDVQVKVHELDIEKDGAAIQRVLQQLTGQRTVPNVFVNNQHVGGNDKVQAAYRSGELFKLLREPHVSDTKSDENNKNKEGRNALRSLIENENKTHQVVVWAKSWCPHCGASKALFENAPQLRNVDVAVHDIDTLPNEEALQHELYRMTGQTTVPNIFVNGKHIGGNSDLQKAFRTGILNRQLQQ